MSTTIPTYWEIAPLSVAIRRKNVLDLVRFCVHALRDKCVQTDGYPRVRRARLRVFELPVGRRVLRQLL